MTGPIVRQYGVPNWDEIFGKKDDKDATTERESNSNESTDEKRKSDQGDAKKD